MLDPRIAAEKLSNHFEATFGDDLRSVVLFGSVARGEAIPGMSDVNVLVLLEAVTPAELSRAAPLVLPWVGAGNTPPLVFANHEWRGMHDTFAIEISDMQDWREPVFGSDPLAEIRLASSDLRLHAERELRDTMLQLRLRMVLAAEDPLELGNLLLSGLPSFSAYMRAALRLSGEEVPARTEDVLARACALIGADPEPMLRCQEARRALRAPSAGLSDRLVGGYTEVLQSLVTYLDRMPQAQGDEGTTARSSSSLVSRAR